MKKSILNALFVFAAYASFSQALPYNFSVSSAPYTTLTNATVVPAVDVWDNEDALVPLGFTFNYDDAPLTQLYLIGYLGGLTTNLDFGPSTDVIFGYGAYDLINGPGTVVQYKTEGTAPNRIFKLEWYKAAFTDADGTVSFQIWLYEGSNNIQVRIGPSSVPDPANSFFNQASPLIGLMVDYNETTDGYTIGYSQWVVGSSNNPADSIIQPYIGFDMPPFGCDGVPHENLVITFSTGALGTRAVTTAESLRFYPNPVVDVVYFNEPAEEKGVVRIYDATGRLHFSQDLPAGTSSCQVPGELPPGTYWLSRDCQGKISVAQFVKS